MNIRMIVIIAITVLVAALALRPSQTYAQKKDFAGVVPFAIPSGSVGFFNQTNGKVYVYDSDLTRCIYEGQLEELGQSFKTIKK